MYPQYNNSGYYGPNISTSGWYSSGGGSAVIYPTLVTSSSSLVGVMESPAVELNDREWLDAQIDEVCALAS